MILNISGIPTKRQPSSEGKRFMRYKNGFGQMTFTKFVLLSVTVPLWLSSFTTATETANHDGDVNCIHSREDGRQNSCNADEQGYKLTPFPSLNKLPYENFVAQKKEKKEDEWFYASSFECADRHDRCSEWTEKGECDTNPNYMVKHCEKSCSACVDEGGTCVDDDDRCSKWAKAEECDANPGYMLNHCKKSCTVCVDSKTVDIGAPQRIKHGENKVIETFNLSRKYLLNEILPNPSLAKIHKSCINQEEECTNWATEGECDANPGYMKLNCALACRSCEMIDVSKRCPLDPNAKEALRPGDLNRLFDRILKNKEYEKYRPKALSRPYHPPEEEKRGDADYIIGPWIVTFDSFLTDEECDRLITLGAEQGYERSTGVGELKVDGTTESVIDESRTSENAWCSEECHSDPIFQKVIKRMENVTGVPETNQEYLQMLKYGVGQFYKSHHDFLENDLEFPSGPRILTFYLYLNDVVKGGGTKFTDLDLTVMPKKGKAVLWTSVLDENPMEEEKNTNHEALPVEEGMKYGANAWIHLRDFKTPHDKGC